MVVSKALVDDGLNDYKYVIYKPYDNINKVMEKKTEKIFLRLSACFSLSCFALNHCQKAI